MITMYDSIELNVPRDAQALAGYAGGRWPTYHTFVANFPALVRVHRILSIAVNAGEKARCLDVETGDATPAQAPWWFRNNCDTSEGKGIIYCSASVISSVVAAMNAAGISRDKYLIWSAHYGFEHICGPLTCGFPQADGTQWNDVALGRNLDVSELNDAFFAPIATPDPYRIFYPGPFPAPRAWFDGKHPNLAKAGHGLNERELVITYDQLNKHPWENRLKLHVVRQELLFLRKRVWTVAHRQLLGGHPSWGIDHRGARWQALNHRTLGVTQEW